MKSIFYGLALGIQFFTVIPLQKTLPMNRHTTTAMYGTFPLIGLCIGTATYGVLFSLLHFEFTPLFSAILLLLTSIVLTGGLHLDGWVDVSDAFFSYQDKEKRHAILEDPRTGAFGVISVVCLLLLKLAIIYEFIARQPEQLWLIIFIPLLARMSVVFFFLTVSTMKEKGIAYYFKENVSAKGLWSWLVFYVITLVIVAVMVKQFILIVCLVSTIVICYFLKRFVMKHFGGMNGDVLGALCEGMEVILWGILLLQFI